MHMRQEFHCDVDQGYQLVAVVLQNLLRFVAVTASAISHHHSTAATVSSAVSPRDAYTQDYTDWHSAVISFRQSVPTSRQTEQYSSRQATNSTVYGTVKPCSQQTN